MLIRRPDLVASYIPDSDTLSPGFIVNFVDIATAPLARRSGKGKMVREIWSLECATQEH